MKLSRRGPRLGMGVALAGLMGLAVSCGSTGASPGSSGDQVFNVTADEFRFSPAEMSLRAGKPARLRLTNVGKLEHDITVEDVSAERGVAEPHGKGNMDHAMGELSPGTVHLSAHGGEQISVDFTPKAGTFEFYCSIPGHREAGMQGTLRVDEG